MRLSEVLKHTDTFRQSQSAMCFGARCFHLPLWLQLVKFYLPSWDKAEPHTAPGNPQVLGPVIYKRGILALGHVELPKGLQIACYCRLARWDQPPSSHPDSPGTVTARS